MILYNCFTFKSSHEHHSKPLPPRKKRIGAYLWGQGWMTELFYSLIQIWSFFPLRPITTTVCMWEAWTAFCIPVMTKKMLCLYQWRSLPVSASCSIKSKVFQHQCEEAENANQHEKHTNVEIVAKFGLFLLFSCSSYNIGQLDCLVVCEIYNTVTHPDCSSKQDGVHYLSIQHET